MYGFLLFCSESLYSRLSKMVIKIHRYQFRNTVSDCESKDRTLRTGCRGKCLDLTVKKWQAIHYMHCSSNIIRVNNPIKECEMDGAWNTHERVEQSKQNLSREISELHTRRGNSWLFERYYHVKYFAPWSKLVGWMNSKIMYHQMRSEDGDEYLVRRKRSLLVSSHLPKGSKQSYDKHHLVKPLTRQRLKRNTPRINVRRVTIKLFCSRRLHGLGM
jgi:hypothetical protein